MRSALAPLREREFRLLFGGRVVSFAGSAMAPIALAFGVLELGGSAGDLGLVLTLSILPQVFFLLAGGVIADRLPRHIVMVASNLVSGLAQAVAAVLLIAGEAEIWHLGVVAVTLDVPIRWLLPQYLEAIPPGQMLSVGAYLAVVATLPATALVGTLIHISA